MAASRAPSPLPAARRDALRRSQSAKHLDAPSSAARDALQRRTELRAKAILLVQDAPPLSIWGERDPCGANGPRLFGGDEAADGIVASVNRRNVSQRELQIHFGFRSIGNGYTHPPSARRRQLTTVVPRSRLAAILRLDIPAAVSRSTSRICALKRGSRPWPATSAHFAGLKPDCPTLPRVEVGR
jgi:hypothetical protein